MAQQALLVRTNGTTEIIPFEDDLDYRVVKKALGITSPISAIPFGGVFSTFVALIDDEGKFVENYHVNPVASSMWVSGHGILMAGHIAGDVVFINSFVDTEGQMTGLGPEQIAFLQTLTQEHFRLAPRLYTQEHDGTWVERNDDGTTTVVEEPSVLHGFEIQSAGDLTVFTDI